MGRAYSHVASRLSRAESEVPAVPVLEWCQLLASPEDAGLRLNLDPRSALRSMVTQDPVPSTNWYTWNVSGSPIQVRLPLLLVHELRRRLDRPLDADADFIHESGLLIGRAPRPGITQITGFHPVPRLDPPTVLEALTRNQGNFIGFYRTTAAGSMSLTPDDLLLAEAYFHQTSSVILLIETGPVGPEEAAFFVWRKGRIDGPPLLPFPFDVYQLSGNQRLAVAEPTEPPPVKRGARSPEPPRRIPEPEVSEEKSPDRPVEPQPLGLKRATPLVRLQFPSRRALWLVSVLVLAGILGYGALHSRFRRSTSQNPLPGSAPPAVASVALGLTVERSGSSLMLSWDTTSPAIRSASKGALLIQTGSEHEHVELSAEQLRSGTYLYKPTGDHLSIRLQVTGPGNVIEDDSMTVFLPKQSDQRPVVIPHQSHSSGAVAPAGSTASPASTAEPQAESRKRLEFPPSASASTSSGKTAPPRLDEPPPIVANPGATPVNSALFNRPVAIPQPGAADSKSSGNNATPTPQAPVAIYQEVPRFPPELKSTLVRSVTVEVAVTINSSGRVTKADVLPGNAHVLLQRSAVEAARNWKFRPAAINGVPVPSDMVLKFNFTPNK